MIGYLLSIFGLLTILLGVVTFFVLPIVPKATGGAKALARFYLWLMAQVLKRGAFVVSAHGDVLLKRMRFDDRGVEIMEFDDGPKAFEDPDQARHRFYGIPFALADEVHGLLFDPRHAAAGQRKADAPEPIYASESEAKAYDIQAWMPGVFEFARDTYELVDLQAVRHLVTGIERAEHPDMIETFVQNSLEPYKDGASASRLLMLVVAVVGPFVGLGLLAGQLGSGESSSVVTFGLLTLVLVPQRWAALPWKRIAGGGLAFVFVAAVLGGIAILAGPATALWFVLTYVLGFVLMAGFILMLGKFVGGVPRLLLKLGFMGYDRPVFVWTPRRYELREYRELGETVGRPTFYGIGGVDVGFTFKPTPDSFASAHIPNRELEAKQAVQNANSNLPVDAAPYPEMKRGEYLAGWVPKQLEQSKFYTHTGVLASAFTHAAVGIKSQRFLASAKEKYGGEGGISDKTFVYTVGGLSAMSFILGVVVFFVL